MGTHSVGELAEASVIPDLPQSLDHCVQSRRVAHSHICVPISELDFITPFQV